jgi:hypothetical protein
MEKQTAVWYPAKETLISGPSFPSSLQILNENQICSFSLNKSHVILMGNFFKMFVEKKMCTANSCYRLKVAMIDFQRQEWFYLTDIYLDFYMLTCRGALGFEKHGKRLVIHYNGQNFYLLYVTVI